MKALMRTEITSGDDDLAPAILEATGLCRTYRQGGREVGGVRDVTLSIPHGQFLAITGPSGSGKSTLMHLLGGLDRPDSGEVVLEGRSFAALDDADLALVRRRRLGFVLQFFNLLPTLTAEENVAFPLMIDGAPDWMDRARLALDSVGLTDRASHRPMEMSGGEQQRVALARALVADPALVLADEPTGNLDSLTGEEILQLLRAAADNGQTIVMVTHDLRAASYADRIIRIVDGALVGEDGS